MTTTAATIPALADVSVKPHPDHADCYTVNPVWDGVDRPDTGGMLVRGRTLALRLERAIRAGVAYVPCGVRTDVNGDTYMDVEARVLGRMLNADLRRLAY